MHFLRRSASVILVAAFLTQPAWAAPVNPGPGTPGNVNVANSPGGSPNVVINQTTTKALISWDKFNVVGENTPIIQPNAANIVLNRMNNGNVGHINGIVVPAAPRQLGALAPAAGGNPDAAINFAHQALPSLVEIEH